MRKLLKEYTDVFPAELPLGLPPEREVDHRIPLLPGTQPVARKQYRLSQLEIKELQRQLEIHLKACRIRRSVSPYNAPSLFVPKKLLNKLRWCLDYRGLNLVSIKDKSTLPLLSELLDSFAGCTVFSKLDLKQAFKQIRVHPDDVHKTAFSTPLGHFEWLVMPEGLCNAPCTFQALMQIVLRDRFYNGVVAFEDDILIGSKNAETHAADVEWVLQQLRKHKLYAEMDKSEFCKSKIDFLGHTISASAVSIQKQKLQAILDWPAPTNVKEVRSFLGLTGYNRRFIKGFSHIAAPLTELLKDDRSWKWGSVESDAFQALKDATCSAPVLVIPNLDLPFTISTDASGFAIGAVLSQDHGKGQQPVAFLSHKLNAAERNYPVHEQELLAIVTAMKEWRCYLLGSKHGITVVTDHRSLQYINTQPRLSPRQIRWVEYLQQFQPLFEVTYRPGKENVIADALSRRSDIEKEVLAERSAQATTGAPAEPRLQLFLAPISTVERSARMDEVKMAAACDEDYQTMLTRPKDWGYSRSISEILSSIPPPSISSSTSQPLDQSSLHPRPVSILSSVSVSLIIPQDHSCCTSVSIDSKAPVDALLDSGSAPSLISHRYYQSLGNNINLQPYTNLTLKSVTGDPLLVLGRISVSLAVGDLKIPSLVDLIVVEDTPNLSTILLGTEFFNKHVHSFEWSTHSLYIRQDTSHRLPLITSAISSNQSPELTPSSNTQAIVTLPRSIKIPPHSSMQFIAQIEGVLPTADGLPTTAVHIFEPCAMVLSTTSPSLPVMLVTPELGTITIQADNPTAAFIRYTAGQVLGTITIAHLVDEATTINSIADYPLPLTIEQRDQQLSSALSEIIAPSLNPQQHSQLVRLLLRNSSCSGQAILALLHQD